MEAKAQTKNKARQTKKKSYRGTILQRGSVWYWRHKLPSGRFTQTAQHGAITRKEAEQQVITTDAEYQRLEQIQDKTDYLREIAEARQMINRQDNISLASIPAAFFNNTERNRITPECEAIYRYTLHRCITWFQNAGLQNIRDITPEDATKYMAHYWRSGISGATYNDTLNRLKIVFRALIGCNADNPFQGIKAKPKQQEERVAFSKEQLSAIWITLSSNDYYILHKQEISVLLILALNTGLRLGDLCLLKWDAIDFQRGILQLIPSKTRHSSKKRVVIPLNGAVIQLLSEWLRTGLETQQSANPETVSSFVLPSIAERYQRNRNGISKDIVKLLEKSGIHTKEDAEDFQHRKRRVIRYSFHSFRHTFASLLINNGTSPVCVSKLLGHSTLAMTNRYIHLDETVARTATASLARAIRMTGDDNSYTLATSSNIKQQGN